MAVKTNARTVTETIGEALKSDAKLISSFGKLTAFATAAVSGEPLSLLATATNVAAAATAAIEGASEVTRRLGKESVKADRSSLNNFERFKVVFFTACSRSYIESIGEVFESLKTQKDLSTSKNPSTPKEIATLKQKLQMSVAKLSEAEVSFLFGVEPLSGPVPLFSAYGEWISAASFTMGIDDRAAHNLITQCDKQARERFRVFLTGNDPIADWMRRYLAIARDEKISELVDGLTSIADSLKDWTEPHKELRKREEKAWASYREMLASLPDLKETMFNEQFGVRKVFVTPEVNYHVAGGAGDTGKPQKSSDIGRLLGALISTRTTGEDLIILCGGPGSGKSTLCRVLASQLAKDENIHPIFIRLRRLKEGSDIGAFIEESLQKLGAINRLSDLREFPNLVIILDGFDELVMASRSRLRQFFNVLREEHSSGSLRGAKIIISGRDTLFPQGDGLPNGSHVVALLPFDKTRVDVWGGKWRALHATGPGSTFEPAHLLDSSKTSSKGSPLHHLVSWPLTLHLVARVHTTGLLDLAKGKGAGKIEKAYLYRSILAETAKRQEDQADTIGRLNPEKMRDFLRDLAWQMYSESRDSMDPTEVMPLLAKYFKDSSDAELSELADVAVVNSPELSKGEETGFEFVHKSFSEYLVAERMAYSLELAIFRAAEFGTEELTWRMSEEDTTRELSPYLGIRLVTEEVQEMLEPMLGSFAPFLKGGRVSEVVSGPVRRSGLLLVIERLESLFKQCFSGESFHTVLSTVRKKQLTQNPLEIFSNYCAGVVLIGTAAVRQLQAIDPKDKKPKLFDGNPVEGAFWRWASILSAGGLQLDRKLASRLYVGMTVQGRDGRILDDRASPLKLGWLSDMDGYRSSNSELVSELSTSVDYLQVFLVIMAAYLQPGRGEPVNEREPRFALERMVDYILHDSMDEIHFRNLESFVDSGILYERLDPHRRMRFDHILFSLREGARPKEVIGKIEHLFDLRTSRRDFSRSGPMREMLEILLEKNPSALDRLSDLFRRR